MNPTVSVRCCAPDALFACEVLGVQESACRTWGRAAGCDHDIGDGDVAVGQSEGGVVALDSVAKHL